MPQTAGRSIARSFRDYRRAADARPRRPDGAAACTLRCLREGQHAGDVDLDGPLSQQRLLGAGRLRPSRGSGPRLCPRVRLRRRGDRPPPTVL